MSNIIVALEDNEFASLVYKSDSPIIESIVNVI